MFSSQLPTTVGYWGSILLKNTGKQWVHLRDISVEKQRSWGVFIYQLPNCDWLKATSGDLAFTRWACLLSCTKVLRQRVASVCSEQPSKSEMSTEGMWAQYRPPLLWFPKFLWERSIFLTIHMAGTTSPSASVRLPSAREEAEPPWGLDSMDRLGWGLQNTELSVAEGLFSKAPPNSHPSPSHH